MLGWILGALAVGAVLGSDSSSKKEIYKKKEDHYYIPTSSYKNTTLGQEEKVEFFDKYRELDVGLGRLVGQGSGGIGLFILTCKYHKLDSYRINDLLENLVEIRDYRNNLAHNKSQWKYLPDPKGYYSETISRVASFVDCHYSEVAKAMMAEKRFLDSKRNGGNY